MTGPRVVRLMLAAAVVMLYGRLWPGSPAVTMAQAPAFDVASVKVNDGGSLEFSLSLRHGTFEARNMPLRWIIGGATSFRG